MWIAEVLAAAGEVEVDIMPWALRRKQLLKHERGGRLEDVEFTLREWQQDKRPTAERKVGEHAEPLSIVAVGGGIERWDLCGRGCRA